MKRRFKLIASIASLTAAVALMAFGVFAAGTRSINVTGTVGFVATNVDATVVVSEDSAANAGAISVAGISTQTFVSNGGNQVGTEVTLTPNLGDDAGNYVYRYTIEVTNDGQSTIYADWAVVADDAGTTAGITRTADADATNAAIAPGATLTYTVTYEVDVAAMTGNSITLAGVGASITLDRDNA